MFAALFLAFAVSQPPKLDSHFIHRKICTGVGDKPGKVIVVLAPVWARTYVSGGVYYAVFEMNEKLVTGDIEPSVFDSDTDLETQ